MGTKMRTYAYALLVCSLSSTQPTTAQEAIADDWEVVDIGIGTKPAFDFDADGDIHIMGMTEQTRGVVWVASAEAIEGPWAPNTLASGYYYGPGDIRVGLDGAIHVAWHDHGAESPAHIELRPDGTQREFVFDTPSKHDGWDNSLAIDDMGGVHMASVDPVSFGGLQSLQYGFFDGDSWTFEDAVPGSDSFMYGLNTSIDVDRNGNPHIVYCNASGFVSLGDLKYAYRDENLEWQDQLLIEGGIAGRFPSMTLDEMDRPHVVWLDIDEDDHTRGFVRYGIVDGGIEPVETIDTLENLDLSFGGARKSVSVALDSDGRPHIAYCDRRVLKYAYKSGGVWESITVASADENLYKGLAVLRLDGNDVPGIVFWQTNRPDPGLIRFARPQMTAITQWRRYAVSPQVLPLILRTFERCF